MFLNISVFDQALDIKKLLVGKSYRTYIAILYNITKDNKGMNLFIIVQLFKIHFSSNGMIKY